MDIVTPLGIEETVEWCNSFVLVLKSNGKVRLCLYPERLKQVLTRPVPKLNNVKYLSLIGASSGYHNLKLDERPSYLTTFGRYRYKRLPFGAAPTGSMLQYKIDEIFKNLHNVFDVPDDILVVGCDTNGKDHEEMLQQMLQIDRKVNLKLNKDKCHFRHTSFPFFGEVTFRHGVQPNP